MCNLCCTLSKLEVITGISALFALVVIGWSDSFGIEFFDSYLKTVLVQSSGLVIPQVN